MKPLVLIVEDQMINQRFLAQILHKMAFSVIVAGDGLEALEKAASRPVDLIFMDLEMPRMDGREAVRLLRERGYAMPIVAVTAGVPGEEDPGGSEGQNKSCPRAGFDDVLVKPYKPEDIRALLQKWFPQNKAERSLAEKKSGKEGGRSGIFDAPDLMHTFLNNTELIAALLKEFSQRTTEQLEAIPRLIEKGDWDEARRIAHMIKGSALTLSGTELGERAAALEKAVKNLRAEEAASAMPRVWEAFGRFKRASEEYLGSGEG
jgi:CheY-like chemotaxis protein/HPt (histidine-containing phosphotransfer) domain-containing protein